MFLPAADPRKEGGVPTDEQGWSPEESKDAGSRRAKQPRWCTQLLTASGPPRSMSSFGSRCLTSPPPSSRRSALSVLQSQAQRDGDPRETAQISSPGLVGAATRSGHARRRAREAKGGRKGIFTNSDKRTKVASGSSSESRAEPGEPPFLLPVYPGLMSPGTHCRGSRRC